jgi:plasmid stabilization system protein ParE
VQTRYTLTPEAEVDLTNIVSYVAQDSIQAAAKVLDDIEAAFMLLSENPGIGHVREDLTDKPVSFWVVHSYLIVFRPETKPLQIVRVLSGYRDIVEQLKL